MIPRTLDLTKERLSLFLFGPRQVGKTYLLKHTLKPNIFINLLDHREYLRYAKDVSILSKEVRALGNKPSQIVIDEIQRCPELLNEVHLLMEDLSDVQFILTGSSARKLRKAGTNLLGGRAITRHLFPLTHEELEENFNLEDVLHHGSLPKIITTQNADDKNRLLKGYVDTYLKEEIQQEALTRNIPAFARFLELAAHENGNILNFQNIAREVGIHSKTIKEYFNILEDTLVGFYLYPYARSHRSRLIAHPKFYFFDRGIATSLRGELSRELVEGSKSYGDAFEHWLLIEIKSILDYRERETKMSFFRTSDGAEVDLILEQAEDIWAVEIKSSTSPRASDVRGLKSFMSDHRCKRTICACRTPRPYTSDEIEFLPWKDFLSQL